MKKMKLAALALSLVGILSAGNAMAATTDVSVTATITGTCRFNAAPTLNLTLDQSLTTDATGTGNLTFWCTNGTAYTLGDEANPLVGDGAFSGTLVAGLNNIPYSIAYTNYTGVGAGKTTAITSALTATVVNADYVNKPAGTYTDTVTFTITP